MEETKVIILFLEGKERGKKIFLSSFPFHMGRLTTNDVVLSDEQASRQHARVEKEPSGYVLVDLRSRNGLFLNGKRVEREELRFGDQIRIGSTVLVFQPSEEMLKEWDSISKQEHSILAEEKEPTEIKSVLDPQSLWQSVPLQSFVQVSHLFRSELPLDLLLSQVVDILFEAFSPERVQVDWNFQENFSYARSRKEGKKCKPIHFPPSLFSTTLTQPTCFREEVPLSEEGQKEVRTGLIAPIRILNQTLGWVYMDRSQDLPRLNPQDAKHLEPLVLVIGAALERSARVQQEKQLQKKLEKIEKYITPEVSKMLASQEINIEKSSLQGEEKLVTILFADIVSFTPLSERLSAQEITQLLNEYFQRMVEVISKHKGEVNKFVGDAIMAIFGAPQSYANDAANAVHAGLEMIETLLNLWKELDESKRFQIRIGINTGKVIAGNIGSERRMEYTVIGDEVNLASRLESISPPNTITIGAKTGALVRDQFRLELVPGVKVKGKQKALEVFRVLGRSLS